MKKMLVWAGTIAILSSSIVLADPASKLIAFQGVKTDTVSATELNQVYGDGIKNALLFKNFVSSFPNNTPRTTHALKLLNRMPVAAGEVDHTRDITREQRINASVEVMNASFLIYQ